MKRNNINNSRQKKEKSMLPHIICLWEEFKDQIETEWMEATLKTDPHMAIGDLKSIDMHLDKLFDTFFI